MAAALVSLLAHLPRAPPWSRSAPRRAARACRSSAARRFPSVALDAAPAAQMNGAAGVRVEERNGRRLDGMVGRGELPVLYDDGFGSAGVRDYLDWSKDIVKPDGGPPRWFCPVECGRPIDGAPLLLFLPGLDGTGVGLIRQHKPLGRADDPGEISNQDLHFPGLLPKIPGRFYFLFGTPTETKGLKEKLRNKDNANILYKQVKSQVENILLYLKKKREDDPYRSILQRATYQALNGPVNNFPSFEP